MNEFYLIEGKFSIENWNNSKKHNSEKILTELSKISIGELVELIFRIRDCRSEQGLGNKTDFYRCVRWLVQNNITQIFQHLKRIPEYGYWKDYLNLWSWVDEFSRSCLLYIFTKQLQKDWDAYENGQTPSLAAKWAPTEGGAYDKIYGMVSIFCEQLNWSKKTYRQRISLLREKLSVSERFFCKKEYGELDFNIMGLKCRKKNQNILNKYCNKRYSRWKNINNKSF
jgi:hypothetical protein